MNALKVSISRVITGLNQGLKTGLHQSGYAAAQHSLLTKQIRLGLALKGGLQNTGTSTADTGAVSQSDILTMTGSILIYSYQTGCTLALFVLGANGVTRSLGSDHEHIYIAGRHDLLKVNVKAVGESQSLAGGQVRFNVLLIDGSLLLIRGQDHDNVSSLCSLSGGHNLQANALCMLPGLGAIVQTNNYVHTALFQVQRMGVTLRTKADHSNGLALQVIQITIFLMEKSCFCHCSFLLKNKFN